MMKDLFRRIVVIVLDSVGVGELPDAEEYGDLGSNTLGHIAERVGGLRLSHLETMGLGNIISVQGVPPNNGPVASYGKMTEASAGKDTTTGHWEMMGIVLDAPFPTYPDGFPADLIQRFEKLVKNKVIGNKTASGTEIIKELGQEHVETGALIVYTSADSVFQIAAHEEVVPLQELYDICTHARELLLPPHDVSRVIARPFLGKSGSFYRTPNRHDFSLSPPQPFVLDSLQSAGVLVTGVGKIEDIFTGKGISRSFRTKSNKEGMERLGSLLQEGGNEREFLFANLIDFDMLYGHRNDVEGYGEALEEFDSLLPSIQEGLKNDDLLIITADHGCDPTAPGTDHTREFVPLLAYCPSAKGIDLGVRTSYADLGATIAENFGVSGAGKGESFLSQLL